MVRIEAVCVCVLFLGGYAGARAHGQDSDGPAPVDTTRSMSAAPDDLVGGRAAEGNGAGPGHASGTYMGVVPGAASAPSPAHPASKGPPTITWPGFQMRPDGSSRVFIQSTAPIEPKVLPAADGKFALRLPGARVAAQTNRLPLDTRFFNTPVTKVSVSVAGAGATVQLDMRAPVTPHVSSERSGSGYYFTYIDLPKGEYIKGSGTSSQATLPLDAKPGTKVIGKPAAVSNTVSARSDGPETQGSARVSAGIQLGH
jgi:hypothetical protein